MPSQESECMCSAYRFCFFWQFYVSVRFKGILKSASFPNSQIYGRIIAIKSTSFSELRSVCVFTLSHDGCGSSLYIICIACYFKWMQNVKVPGIHSVRLTRVSSTEKLTNVPLIKTNLKAKSNTILNGVESPKFRRLSSWYFQAVFMPIWAFEKDIDLRIECRFENLRKGHRSEVQMSVT